MQKGSAEGIEGMGKMRRMIRYFAVIALLASSATVAFVMLYNNVSEFEVRLTMTNRYSLNVYFWNNFSGIWTSSSPYRTTISSCFARISGIAPVSCKQARLKIDGRLSLLQ
jgi:hypothetical protein